MGRGDGDALELSAPAPARAFSKQQEMLQRLQTLAKDPAVSNQQYRRLLRQAGIRGSFEKIACSARLKALTHPYSDSLSASYQYGPDGKPLKDQHGRPIVKREVLRHWQQIVEKLVGPHQQTDDPPKVTVMAGGPGSGKTFIRTQHLSHTAEHLHIDPDHVQEYLSLYPQAVATGDPAWGVFTLYKEKKEVMKMALETAIQKRVNFALDVTGAQPDFPDQLQNLIDNGYQIEVVYVDAPLETALDRTTTRGRNDGRWMSDEIIAQSHAAIANRLPQILELDFIPSLKVYANESAQPELIAEAQKGQLVEHNPLRLQQMLNKKNGLEDPSVILGYTDQELS